jgi:hypothetical protein
MPPGAWAVVRHVEPPCSTCRLSVIELEPIRQLVRKSLIDVVSRGSTSHWVVPEPWLRPRQCRRGADPACGVPACTGEDLLAHQPSALILRASLALVQAHVTERRTQARTLPRRSGTTPLGAGLASPGSAGQQLAAAVRSTCDAGSAPRHPVARHVESSGSTCRCSDATRSPSDLRGQVPGSTGRATPQDAPRNRSIGCSMGSTKRSAGPQTKRDDRPADDCRPGVVVG